MCETAMFIHTNVFISHDFMKSDPIFDNRHLMYWHLIMFLDTIVSKMQPQNKSTVIFSFYIFCKGMLEQWGAAQWAVWWRAAGDRLHTFVLSAIWQTVLLLCVKLLAPCAAWNQITVAIIYWLTSLLEQGKFVWLWCKQIHQLFFCCVSNKLAAERAFPAVAYPRINQGWK